MALRKSTANALVASTVWMLDEASPVLLRIMIAVPKPWVSWHSHQNRTLRSANGSLECALEQTSGGYLAVVAEVWGALQSEQTYRYMQFVFEPSQAQRQVPPDDPEIAMENERVGVACKLATSLCRVRLNGGLHLVRGWPEQTVKFLAGDDERRATLNLFQRHIRAVAGGGPQRHLLGDIAAEQPPASHRSAAPRSHQGARRLWREPHHSGLQGRQLGVQRLAVD